MSVTADSKTGTLYIVPTPIGNLKDITLRAIDVLQQVDLIAAEDTRHTGALLQHLGITTSMISLHEHNEDKRSEILIEKLQCGENIALVSDAGTPLICDPGYTLVNRCRASDLNVVALPGPSAVITALSGAGMPTDAFTFLGFLPVKQQAKREALRGLVDANGTSVFYEAPRRVLDTLAVINDVLGPKRQIALVKELSKAFESYQLGNAQFCIDWLMADANRQKGEFVILVAANKQKKADIPAQAVNLLKSLSDELPLKKAASIVAAHYGLKKNQLYQVGLSLQ